MTLLIYIFISGEDAQMLDDMGDWLDQLMTAQNQTNSKLSELIRILVKMKNFADKGICVCHRSAHYYKIFTCIEFCKVSRTANNFRKCRSQESCY